MSLVMLSPDLHKLITAGAFRRGKVAFAFR
jgi:hypothetical protein